MNKKIYGLGIHAIVGLINVIVSPLPVFSLINLPPAFLLWGFFGDSGDTSLGNMFFIIPYVVLTFAWGFMLSSSVGLIYNALRGAPETSGANKFISRKKIVIAIVVVIALVAILVGVDYFASLSLR